MYIREKSTLGIVQILYKVTAGTYSENYRDKFSEYTPATHFGYLQYIMYVWNTSI